MRFLVKITMQNSDLCCLYHFLEKWKSEIFQKLEKATHQNLLSISKPFTLVNRVAGVQWKKFKNFEKTEIFLQNINIPRSSTINLCFFLSRWRHEWQFLAKILDFVFEIFQTVKTGKRLLENNDYCGLF